MERKVVERLLFHGLAKKRKESLRWDLHPKPFLAALDGKHKEASAFCKKS